MEMWELALGESKRSLFLQRRLLPPRQAERFILSLYFIYILRHVLYTMNVLFWNYIDALEHVIYKFILILSSNLSSYS